MNLGGNMKWVLLIGGILVCAVCAIVATSGNLLGGLLGGNPTSPVVVGSPTDFPPVVVDDDPLAGNAKLSQIVTARSVGEGNEPLQTTNQFTTSDSVIYAVAQGNVPSGTRVFARWSREGSPFEDTNEIVADRDYQNTYIEFHISPDGKALTPGNYTVQFFVNGNPGPQAQFTIT
jgi:hypothetical protein